MSSGDVGYYDEDGHMIISDRIKEMIKVKGYQVKLFKSTSTLFLIFFSLQVTRSSAVAETT